MPDISALGAALSSIKAAKDIGEAMIGLRDTAAFQGKLLEFQSKIIDANNAAFAAQDERAAMLEKISDLEKQVTEFENWEAEKQRYELYDIGEGKLVYRQKEGMQPSQPAHDICANCYENRKKSILQRTEWMPGRSQVLVCHECGSVIYEFGAAQPEHDKLRPKPRR